eukprot:scpid42652/ scgid21311/ 
MKRPLSLRGVVAVVSAAFFACGLSCVTADCHLAVGSNLLDLKSALTAYGARTAHGCFDLVSSLLDPLNSSTSTNVSGSDPVRDTIVSLYNYSISLASQTTTTARLQNDTGVSCWLVHESGMRVRQRMQECRCAKSGKPTCPLLCLQAHSQDILELAERVRLCPYNNGSAATMQKLAQGLSQSLPAALRFMQKMPHLLKSVRGLNNVMTKITSLPQLSHSTAATNGSKSSVSPGEYIVLVCTAIFPICAKSAAPGGGVIERNVPVCEWVCDRLGRAVGVLGLFANASAIPIVSLVTEALAAGTCPPRTSKSYSCLHLSRSGIGVINSSRTRSSSGSLCLNLTCPSPLIATRNSANWNTDLQSVVFGVHSLVRLAFPDATSPFNGSILPCGMGCAAIGVSENSAQTGQIFLSVFSTIAVVCVTFSVVVFGFNRKRLGQQLVRRVLLAVTINGGIASLPFTSSAYNNPGTLLCHDDGTILLNEPGKGNPRCPISAITTYFFVTVLSGYCVALAHSWFRLIGALHKPHLHRKKTSMDIFHRTYRYDFIYATCTVLPALILSTLLLVLGGIEGNLIKGVCSVTIAKNYFVIFYVAYFSLTLLLAVVFLMAGVRALKARGQGMSGVVNWIKKGGRWSTFSKQSIGGKHNEDPNSQTTHQCQASWSGMDHHERKRRKEINRLAFQVLCYCFVAIVNLICTVILGAYVGVQGSQWKRQVEEHVVCVMTRCEPNTCPPLPSPQIAFIVFPVIVQFSSLALISCWTFTPECLVNVPLVKRLFMRRSPSGTQTASSDLDTMESTLGEQLSMNPVDTLPATAGPGAVATTLT